VEKGEIVVGKENIEVREKRRGHKRGDKRR
jgi:hypothetical protein